MYKMLLQCSLSDWLLHGYEENHFLWYYEYNIYWSKIAFFVMHLDFLNEQRAASYSYSAFKLYI